MSGNHRSSIEWLEIVVGKSLKTDSRSSRRYAVVHDTPGVTRDRNYADVVWADRAFTIVDTGGLDVDPDDRLIDNVQAQVDAALAEAKPCSFCR